MPYSLIHCKTIRTGIHKGNPLVPLGKQLGVQLFFACSFPCLPQGGYRGPNPAGPLNALCFLSVITERKCLRGTSAERLYFLKRRTDCHGAKAPLNDRGVRIAAGLKLLAMTYGVDCRTPCGGLACRLGQCFCFAEVSTGHPHRNDKDHL